MACLSVKGFRKDYFESKSNHKLEAWSSYAATACTGVKGKVGSGITQDLGTPFQASGNVDFIEIYLPHAVSDITQGWDGSFMFLATEVGELLKIVGCFKCYN